MAKANDVINTTTNMREETPQEVIARIEGQMVQVYLAPAQKGENNAEFVGLNGKGFLVPRGRPTYVPTAVYDILRRSFDARVYSEAYEKQVASQLSDKALS